MSIASKLRTALKLGPIGTIRAIRERSVVPRERAAVARGSQWPVADVVAAVPTWWPSNDVDLDDLQASYPDDVAATVARADRFCAHEFDFLGSGPTLLGDRIDWDRDFKSGKRWPKEYMADLCLVDLDDSSDVKVPWELGRHQHFVTLGQAYVLTRDERYALEYKTQLLDWMEGNPPLVGVTWACTMDVALRAISWTWARVLFSESPSLDETFWRRVTAGLIAHGDFILNHLEWGDVRGNHYLSDGAGLAVLGTAFPELPGARAWRDKGFEIVWGEMPLQILSDGVDFEASTAYQRLVVELIVTPTLLAERAGLEVPASVWPCVERMLEFVAAATRPDGCIAQFGDSDDGRVQILSEKTRAEITDHRYLLALGAARFARGDFKTSAAEWFTEVEWLLGTPSRRSFEELTCDPGPRMSVFPKGGFVTARGERTWMMSDFGPVGLAGRGGHGHNDASSFEFALGDQPVIVDPGTYVYSADPEARDRMRSTLSHNVAVVDGLEMADLGNLWTIADDARAELIDVSLDGRSVTVRGRHHGYERLDHPVTCARTLLLDDSAARLEVTDELTGEGTHDIELAFHTPLDARIGLDGSVMLTRDSRSVASVRCDAAAEPFVEPCWLSPSYGVRNPGRRFGWRIAGAHVPVVVCSSIEGVRG